MAPIKVYILRLFYQIKKLNLVKKKKIQIQVKTLNIPLGGEFGKSRDNNNFMRKTPFSYGVPAARVNR